MSLRFRNNVNVYGSGANTVVFAHGFGCDQTMWRFLAPHLEDRFRVIVYDMVGMGGSDLAAYDRCKYRSLHGHAADLIEIIDAYACGEVVFIGHSVSAMIGLLATIAEPWRFAGQVMVSPSPCYTNDGDYVGGFNPEDMDGLLNAMDADFLGWSLNVAPMIMGAPRQPELSRELIRSFLRNDQAITKHWARVAFLADHRADLAQSTVPALILHCSDDLLVPHEVGLYLHHALPNSTFHVIDNVGHCPHLSAADASYLAIDTFLEKTLRRAIGR